MSESGDNAAYLVIREGSKWTDVFRLLEGESVTIGRAPTNRVVVKDERCSRNHAEVFSSKGSWVLRDLESRNGTTVNNKRVGADHVLSPGDIIRVGSACMAYVDDLSKAFPDSGSVLRASQPITGSTDAGLDPAIDLDADDSVFDLEPNEPTHITHRRQQSRYLEPGYDLDSVSETGSSSPGSTPKVGRAAAVLCRLAFELAKSPDTSSIATVALDGLLTGTPADAGAILLCDPKAEGNRSESLIEVVQRSDSPHKYQQVSQFLAETVLREGQGVLARNIMDDSQLGARDSSGDILATSVLCAPFRHERVTWDWFTSIQPTLADR